MKNELTGEEPHLISELMDAISPEYSGASSIELRRLVEEVAEGAGYSPDQLQELANSIFEKTKS